MKIYNGPPLEFDQEATERIKNALQTQKYEMFYLKKGRTNFFKAVSQHVRAEVMLQKNNDWDYFPVDVEFIPYLALKVSGINEEEAFFNVYKFLEENTLIFDKEYKEHLAEYLWFSRNAVKRKFTFAKDKGLNYLSFTTYFQLIRLFFDSYKEWINLHKPQVHNQKGHETYVSHKNKVLANQTSFWLSREFFKALSPSFEEVLPEDNKNKMLIMTRRFKDSSRTYYHNKPLLVVDTMRFCDLFRRGHSVKAQNFVHLNHTDHFGNKTGFNGVTNFCLNLYYLDVLHGKNAEEVKKQVEKISSVIYS